MLILWIKITADADSINRKIPENSEGSTCRLSKLPCSSDKIPCSSKLQGIYIYMFIVVICFYGIAC